MKLYEVPNNNYVRIQGTEDVFYFDHLDGMYSFCKDSEGNIIHLSVGTPVEIVDPRPDW